MPGPERDLTRSALLRRGAAAGAATGQPAREGGDAVRDPLRVFRSPGLNSELLFALGGAGYGSAVGEVLAAVRAIDERTGDPVDVRRDLLRARLVAGAGADRETLAARPDVDARRIAAVGISFLGMVLVGAAARIGDLAAVVLQPGAYSYPNTWGDTRGMGAVREVARAPERARRAVRSEVNAGIRGAWPSLSASDRFNIHKRGEIFTRQALRDARAGRPTTSACSRPCSRTTTATRWRASRSPRW